MDPARWARIQELFHQAVELSEPDRIRLLDTACAADPALRDEVLAMLREDATASSILDRDLPHLADGLIADPTDALPDGDFGPYRLLRKLGAGGMGVVYLAERHDLGNHVAIKVLPHAGLSPARQSHFTSEQKHLANLVHPSIARLYDAGVDTHGTPWFAMEYIEGQPLDAYCRERQLSIEQRLQLVRAVCQAVQYAHSQAIIHRDLKPSNILVTASGSPRLLDFGISKRLDDSTDTASATRTVWRLMTPAYASPEQVRSLPMGVYSDVYSLGVILYELLAGRLPYDLEHHSPGEVESIIVTQDPPKPTTNADLNVLCLTAMHKDPAQRYASVEALIRDIDHFLRHEPLEARPDRLGYRVGKFLRRHRTPVITAALASLTFAALAGVFTWRLARARDTALAEAARTQRLQQFLIDLFAGGDQNAGPAGDLRVVTLLDRGSSQVSAFSDDPRSRADLELALGNIYTKLGRFEQADHFLTAARDRRQALLGPGSTETAQAAVALGTLRVEQAKLADARQLIEAALAVERPQFPPGHPAILAAETALGHALIEAGKYDDAVQVLEHVVAARTAQSPASTDLSSCLRLLADAQFYLGHYPASDSLNRRLLAMDQQLYGDRHPKVAEDWVNLGHIQTQWGNYAAAERNYRHALEINQAWYGRDHPETANSTHYVAQALYNQSRFEEARALLPGALAATEHAYGPNHPRVALIVGLLGNIALDTHHLDEAEHQFSRMARIYEAVYGPNHMMTAMGYATLGRIYSDRHQYDRAEQLYRDVLRRYDAAHLSHHMNAGVARVHLGHVLLLAGRHAAAEPETLAGYNILKRQTSPKIYWLQKARADLVDEYTALHQPEKAARYRTEIAAR